MFLKKYIPIAVKKCSGYITLLLATGCVETCGGVWEHNRMLELRMAWLLLGTVVSCKINVCLIIYLFQRLHSYTVELHMLYCKLFCILEDIFGT